MSHLFDRHCGPFADALRASGTNGVWSAFPEIPSGKFHGETALCTSAESHAARRGRAFARSRPAESAGAAPAGRAGPTDAAAIAGQFRPALRRQPKTA